MIDFEISTPGEAKCLSSNKRRHTAGNRAKLPASLIWLTILIGMAALAGFQGCKRETSRTTASAKPLKHEHKPPHGGTPVVLGEEQYHLELLLDPTAGKIQAYVMDGELENFVRVPAGGFEIRVRLPDGERVIALKAVGNNATGETVGDTSLFEAQADWLKQQTNFDAEVTAIEVRQHQFQHVSFNFPKGNDQDEK